MQKHWCANIGDGGAHRSQLRTMRTVRGSVSLRSFRSNMLRLHLLYGVYNGDFQSNW